MGIFTDTTHLHIFTWVVAIILFLVAAVMAKGSKGRKIVHMILRLFYILVILSGAFLFFAWSSSDAAMYGVKFLLGVVTIGFMEMVLVRQNKDKPTTVFWALFFISLLATMFIGMSLPIGMDFF
ncbi:YisL family protein [Bhargavaea ginsengi]|uniref:YisL family protein n=1 Tax=Bhargavaea ginsengi TaxID=426757 RepID=UPI0020415AD0|nr:YisL family protein [Bhargavaea ginsengi]MCM3088142.1 YisL family protein [Bhargavaea ginsengi]